MQFLSFCKTSTCLIDDDSKLCLEVMIFFSRTFRKQKAVRVHEIALTAESA